MKDYQQEEINFISSQNIKISNLHFSSSSSCSSSNNNNHNTKSNSDKNLTNKDNTFTTSTDTTTITTLNNPIHFSSISDVPIIKTKRKLFSKNRTEVNKNNYPHCSNQTQIQNTATHHFQQQQNLNKDSAHVISLDTPLEVTS